MDIFFVNEIPSLITLSRNIDFTATSHLPTRKDRYIFISFWRICVLYLKLGFKITTFHADGEFDPVQELLAYIPSRPMVKFASANDHVPKTEQKNRLVKEMCRATSHSLIFIRLPVIININILLNNVQLSG